MPKPNFAATPRGRGEVETYTVLFDHQNKSRKEVVVARLENQARFIANTSNDLITYQAMFNNETIGSIGKVATQAGLNHF